MFAVASPGGVVVGTPAALHHPCLGASPATSSGSSQIAAAQLGGACYMPATSSCAMPFPQPAVAATCPTASFGESKLSNGSEAVQSAWGIQAAWAVDGLANRLAAVALSLSSRCGSTISVAQVWRSTLGPNLDSLAKQGSNEIAVLPAFQVPYVHDAQLSPFMEASRTRGISGSELGAIAQVWSKGALHVVQHVSSMPSDCHPRTKLEGGAASAVGEVVYIPVYEQHSPLPHVVAVLELLVSSFTKECMVVANVISLASELLAQVQLSISRPSPAPVATPAQRTLPQQQVPGSASGPSPLAAPACGSASRLPPQPRSSAGRSSAGSTGGGSSGSVHTACDRSDAGVGFNGVPLSRTSSMIRTSSVRGLLSFNSA